ncbi:MAG: hypothetical protein GEU89_12965 [Kiloniellaceae bacterium]|nr:hypothetical protein [Kiloniellaceae bacterium]
MAESVPGVFFHMAALIARHGDVPLQGLGGRFRCTLCGHRPAKTMLGWHLPPATAEGWVVPVNRRAAASPRRS